MSLRVYEAGCQAGWGLRHWGDMASELWQARGLAWRLFLRSFTARYKQTLLGVVGVVVTPLLSMLAFVLLNATGVINVGETNAPYPVFALLSLTIWSIFADGMRASANAIVGNANLVVKVNFARETLVLASFGEVLVGIGIRMIMVAVVFTLYGTVPAWSCLLLPFALLPLVLLTMGAGFLTALGNAVMRDVGNFLTMGVSLLMLITPVLYAPPKHPLFQAVMAVNPLAALVRVPRDLVLGTPIESYGAFGWSSLFALVLFLLAWRTFHLCEPHLAKGMGN